MRRTAPTQRRSGGDALRGRPEREAVTAPIAWARCYEQISANPEEDRNIHQRDDTCCNKHLIIRGQLRFFCKEGIE